MTSSVAMMTSPAATSPSSMTSCGGWKTATGGVQPASAAAAVMLAGGGTSMVGKDSGWLTLEVCREFARQRCSRSDSDCRYAHPPPHVDVQNGRVVCCFDSIKVSSLCICSWLTQTPGRSSILEQPCSDIH